MKKSFTVSTVTTAAVRTTTLMSRFKIIGRGEGRGPLPPIWDRQDAVFQMESRSAGFAKRLRALEDENLRPKRSCWWSRRSTTRCKESRQNSWRCGDAKKRFESITLRPCARSLGRATDNHSPALRAFAGCQLRWLPSARRAWRVELAFCCWSHVCRCFYELATAGRVPIVIDGSPALTL
jgi:hypothetical protein